MTDSNYYKVLSLFSGMGGMDIGFSEDVVVHKNSVQENYIDSQSTINNFVNLKRLPFKTVFQNDILPEAKRIAELNNWNHNYILKDIIELLKENYTFPDADVIIGGFPCFIAGTKIQTNTGYKNIENINIEDNLLTHTGKFQRIINLQKKIYSGKLYELDIKYHPEIITCTEEHPFYVKTRTKKWDNLNKIHIYNFENPEWKKASELTLNDYCGMVINNNNIIPEFIFTKKINQITNTKESIILNDLNMWYMMGYFVGDGWIEESKKSDGIRLSHKIRFAINNKDEQEVLEKIRKILPITDKKCDTGKCKKFGCANFTWYNIFQHFGKYAHGKMIPEWIQDAPKEYIQEFINGYMKADGYINNETLSITTVSYNLAYGLQRLYLKLGHISSITKYIRPLTTVIEGRIVNQRDTYIIRIKLNKMRNISSFIKDNYVWFPIFKITTTNANNINVYNFEVDNDNSYIVENTIVHNCQNFSHSGKREGFNTTRGTLYQSYVEVVKRVKPILFIAENVNGLLTMPDEPIKKIIKDFSEVGYEVKYQLIKCEEYGIPQTRWRVIIMGIRLDKRPLLVSGDNWNIITENKIQCVIKHYFQHLQEPNISEDPAQQVYSKAKRLEKGQGQKEILLNGYAPTMRAEHHGNIEFRRIKDGNNNENVELLERRLSVREAALIQTFPPNCILTEPEKKTSKAYKPIGNAVPPLLAYIIARKTLEILEKVYSQV